MSGDLWRLDGVALAGLIRTGTVSARDAVSSHLQRLHAVNPQINAVVRTLDEQALAEADAADRALRAGEAIGPLHGLPITTKINSDQAGCPTDNGLAIYKDLVATEDSPQVGSLRRAGAIVIGRTNAPAFSMRGMTENALHGLTLNPWNRDLTCGGSSGGAGVQRGSRGSRAAIAESARRASRTLRASGPLTDISCPDMRRGAVAVPLKAATRPGLGRRPTTPLQ